MSSSPITNSESWQRKNSTNFANWLTGKLARCLAVWLLIIAFSQDRPKTYSKLHANSMWWEIDACCPSNTHVFPQKNMRN